MLAVFMCRVVLYKFKYFIVEKNNSFINKL